MIEIKNLCKTYSLTDGSVEALKDVSLSIPDGDVFGIIGMSGAGKSTLVRCINMLERPTAGSVVIDGKDLTKMTEKELRAERQSITMIFQGFNLLMQKNCLRNVCFPLELAGVKKADATGKPIIARMATEIGVEANIAYASTRSIEGRAYGSMLLSIEDKNDDLARAIGYLTQDGDITAQEVTQYAE